MSKPKLPVMTTPTPCRSPTRTGGDETLGAGRRRWKQQVPTVALAAQVSRFPSELRHLPAAEPPVPRRPLASGVERLPGPVRLGAAAGAGAPPAHAARISSTDAPVALARASAERLTRASGTPMAAAAAARSLMSSGSSSAISTSWMVARPEVKRAIDREAEPELGSSDRESRKPARFRQAPTEARRSVAQPSPNIFDQSAVGGAGPSEAGRHARQHKE